jgi:hypothetical protein
VSFASDVNGRQEQVKQAVRQAAGDWAAAMRTHTLAPPDAGFAARLRALSEAADHERAAWEQAHAAGLRWRPVRDAAHGQPPYELRPGTGRRGPVNLWEAFDAAVGNLNEAITGDDAAAVASAFGELSRAASALADAVAGEDAVGARQDEAAAGHGQVGSQARGVA